jgi:tripartite ATP-independent transporter DctM subunit
MYLGAIGPSVAQVLLFSGFILLVSLFQPHKVPALPPEARTLSGSALAKKLAWGMVPSLVLIFLVLGTIFMGLATPTEAGAMGSAGAILLAVTHGRFSWKMVWEASEGTMRITAMVIFILIGATVFSLVFQGVNGGKWIEHLLSHIPGGRLGFLIFVNIFIFFIAFFLDFFEIVFIIIPLLIPTAVALDINLVWLGVLICVNMQTAFMHPPFGFALFYLRGIAPPEVSSRDIYLGSIPFIILQLILVALIITFPGIVDAFISAPVLLDDAAIDLQLEAIPMPDLAPPTLDLDLGPAPALPTPPANP